MHAQRDKHPAPQKHGTRLAAGDFDDSTEHVEAGVVVLPLCARSELPPVNAAEQQQIIEAVVTARPFADGVEQIDAVTDAAGVGQEVADCHTFGVAGLRNESRNGIIQRETSVLYEQQDCCCRKHLALAPHLKGAGRLHGRLLACIAVARGEGDGTLVRRANGEYGTEHAVSREVIQAALQATAHRCTLQTRSGGAGSARK